MADNNTPEVIIKVSADTTGIEQGIKETKTQLNDLNNTDADKSIKSLKTQLRESKEEAERLGQQFGKNSEEFKKAARAVANLKDEIEENNAMFNAFNPDNKLQSLVGVARTAATAVQGVGGAMTFLGVESETAMETMAKLQGIMAFTDALNSIGDLTDFWKGYIMQLKAAKAATEATTTATRGFGLAFKAIGIGLVISAIAYLVTNWDDLKKSMTDLFPALENTGDLFDDLKSILAGVGNAVLQGVIMPIKTLIQLVQGDFKGAIDEIKKGLNVIDNFQDGKNKSRLSQEQDKLNAIIEKNIKAKEKELEIAKAKGEDTYKLEKEIIKKKLSLQKQGTEEYEALLHEERVLEAKHRAELANKKKQADEKAAQERDADNKRKAAEDEAKKKEDERKAAEDLERKKKEAKVIDKFIYDKEQSRLSEYEQKRNAINKEIDELLETADDEQDKKLEAIRASQLGALDRDNALNTVAIQAETNLIHTETYNAIDENDSPEEIKQKIDNVYNAKVNAENANFELEKERLKGNKEAIEKLEAQHNKNLVDIEQEAADKKKQIDDAAKEAKLKNLELLSSAVGVAGQFFEENTVAGKALAISQTTIDTYLAAQKAYASQLIPGDPSSIVRAQIAAGVAVAAGLANVKKILSVKVGNRGVGGMSGDGMSTPQAPLINVNQLQEQNVQDVRVTNEKDTVIKAYITERELETYEQKKDFMNKTKI